MDIQDIIKLLNKRTTTVENILVCLKEMIEKYQQDREDLYTSQYIEQLSFTSPKKPDEDQLSLASEKIVKQINTDTQKFIREYVSKTTDDVLDAINSKQLKRKSAAHAFLTILLAAESAYDPKKSIGDV